MAEHENGPAEFNTVGPAPDSRCYREFDAHTTAGNYFSKDLIETLSLKSPGVTIKPVQHNATSITARSLTPQATDTVLETIQAADLTRDTLIDSSLPKSNHDADPTFSVSGNGFVYACLEAYNNHHNLVIRPNDIWLAIISQFSSYVNANADSLRGSFVGFSGKQELEIKYSQGDRFTTAWDDFAFKIGIMLQDNIVNPELREWTLPAFSTTETHDVVVASIVMMATMQSYFEYKCYIRCGIPSVTLLGTKEDYGLILARFDKLRDTYGEEPTQFAELLTPVLKRLVLSFTSPDSDEVKDFWNRICSRNNVGSRENHLLGWITAFLFWDKEGSALWPGPEASMSAATRARMLQKLPPPLELDGIRYHSVDEGQVVPGFCTVPVSIDDNGLKIEAEMGAGSVGWGWSCSGVEIGELKAQLESESVKDGFEEVMLDTVQPRTGWWIYEKASTAEVKERRRERLKKPEERRIEQRLKGEAKRLRERSGRKEDADMKEKDMEGGD